MTAWKHGGKLDVLVQILGLISIGIPSFWLGLTLLLVFAFYFPIFPLGAAVTPGVTFKSFGEFAYDVLYHAALPVTTLTIVTFFGDAFIMRNTMVEVLGEDFVLTAEAKGLSDKTVMFKHAARNALLPFVTRIIMSLGFMVTGNIFVETAFSYPGIGLLLTESIFSRDFPVAQGILILITLIFLVSNFIGDLIYIWLDPRIKLTR